MKKTSALRRLQNRAKGSSHSPSWYTTISLSEPHSPSPSHSKDRPKGSAASLSTLRSTHTSPRGIFIDVRSFSFSLIVSILSSFGFVSINAHDYKPRPSFVEAKSQKEKANHLSREDLAPRSGLCQGSTRSLPAYSPPGQRGSAS